MQLRNGETQRSEVAGNLHRVQDLGYSLKDLATVIGLPANSVRREMRSLADGAGEQVEEYSIEWSWLWWQS